MSDREDARAKVRALLREDGRTYADEAGIRLADKPAPLFELLLLALLLSTRISTDIALEASRQLRQAGWRTPEKLLESTWQQRVDVLGRAHYRRYDESTATILDKQARWLLDTYDGDLRRLGESAEREAGRCHQLLEEVPGLGPVGASIYLREVQAVWHWLRPYADDKVRAAARDIGIPHSVRSLVELAGSQDLSVLGAALIRADS